ncbi:uncharacterized protein VP01_1004g11 [Puccinia sorghi]|uniref:Uncharacterized protein n=1 Tax=Puccinia sorghi TaxID=27349 RepID=A0A0L6VV80_9BASI|nr:uncharacterized protein VP01_1004g11 [Puccinia sorghi]
MGSKDWGSQHWRPSTLPNQELPPLPPAHQTPLHHPSSPSKPVSHDLNTNPYWLTRSGKCIQQYSTQCFEEMQTQKSKLACGMGLSGPPFKTLKAVPSINALVSGKHHSVGAIILFLPFTPSQPLISTSKSFLCGDNSWTCQTICSSNQQRPLLHSLLLFLIYQQSESSLAMPPTVEQSPVHSAIFLAMKITVSTTPCGNCKPSNSTKKNQEVGKKPRLTPKEMNCSGNTGFDEQCHTRIQLNSRWWSQCTSFLKQKSMLDVDHQLQTKDHFDEDEYEALREEEQAPFLNSSGIDLTSLQEALMEIDQEIEDQHSSLNVTNIFSTEDLSTIRCIIGSTIIPSWLRPSLLFGDTSSGKVCLADWVTCFTTFMPFAFVESQKSKQSEFVNSWYHIAMLTKLVMEYRAEEIQNKYFFHLTSYRSNLNKNYPHLNPTPNHHMAFQIPKQLKNFGPANHLASWRFEQVKGILQKIQQKNKQAIRASNLVILMESPDLPPLLAKHSPLSTQKKKIQSLLGNIMSDLHNKGTNLCEESLAKFKFNFPVPPHLYGQVLKLMIQNHPNSQSNYINEQKGSFSSNNVPIPSVAKTIYHFKHMGLTYTDSSNSRSRTIEYKLQLNDHSNNTLQTTQLNTKNSQALYFLLSPIPNSFRTSTSMSSIPRCICLTTKKTQYIDSMRLNPSLYIPEEQNKAFVIPFQLSKA